jgi:hypothetical protein
LNVQKLFILFNTVISFLWIIILYFLNNKIFLLYPQMLKYKKHLIVFINNYIYFSIIILGSIIVYWWIYKLKSKLKSNNLHNLKKIVPIYKDYLPIFLGIVIISLSLKNNYSTITEISIFSFLFIIFYMSKIAFLNPILYFLGFRIYKVETDKTEYILISNEKDYKNITSDNLRVAKLDEEILIYIKENK